MLSPLLLPCFFPIRQPGSVLHPATTSPLKKWIQIAAAPTANPSRQRRIAAIVLKLPAIAEGARTCRLFLSGRKRSRQQKTPPGFRLSKILIDRQPRFLPCRFQSGTGTYIRHLAGQIPHCPCSVDTSNQKTIAAGSAFRGMTPRCFLHGVYSYPIKTNRVAVIASERFPCSVIDTLCTHAWLRLLS